MAKVSFVITFENDFESDDYMLQHVWQTTRAIGTNVHVRMLLPESIAIDRARFERLLDAASYAETVNWKLADLAPGDLDPIP